MTGMAKSARAVLGFGLLVAALTIVADQATKYLVLTSPQLEVGERIAVTSFFDLVLAMNKGISYGLFPQHTEMGRWLLVMVNLAAAGLFIFWLSRAGDRFLAAAIGFLIGGAVGNAIDRVLYGAVVDFVLLHWGEWRWYVFNVADAAVVAGVIGLLYDALMSRATK